MRFHLDAYAEDLVRSGVPRREAIRRARIHFGSVEALKDDCRQARGLRLVDDLASDTKHAGRVRAAVTSRVAVGAASGCAAAMILGTALEAVLYGVRPSDLVSFAAAVAALLIVATGAAFAAAMRATRISPVEVLRGN